jgi:hypothetical protein
MNSRKVWAISIWMVLCGVGLLSIIVWQSLWEGWTSLVAGVLFYPISITPIVFLERGLDVSRARYIITLSLSVTASILATRLFLGPMLPFSTIAPLLPLYLLMGSWALCTVWFFLIVKKYALAKPWAKVYAWLSVIVVNSGLLGFLMIGNFSSVNIYR